MTVRDDCFDAEAVPETPAKVQAHDPKPHGPQSPYVERLIIPAYILAEAQGEPADYPIDADWVRIETDLLPVQVFFDNVLVTPKYELTTQEKGTTEPPAGLRHAFMWSLTTPTALRPMYAFEYTGRVDVLGLRLPLSSGGDASRRHTYGQVNVYYGRAGMRAMHSPLYVNFALRGIVQAPAQDHFEGPLDFFWHGAGVTTAEGRQYLPSDVEILSVAWALRSGSGIYKVAIVNRTKAAVPVNYEMAVALAPSVNNLASGVGVGGEHAPWQTTHHFDPPLRIPAWALSRRTSLFQQTEGIFLHFTHGGLPQEDLEWILNCRAVG